MSYLELGLCSLERTSKRPLEIPPHTNNLCYSFVSPISRSCHKTMAVFCTYYIILLSQQPDRAFLNNYNVVWRLFWAYCISLPKSQEFHSILNVVFLKDSLTKDCIQSHNSQRQRQSWNKFLDFNTKGLFYVWEFDKYANHQTKERGNNQEHGVSTWLGFACFWLSTNGSSSKIRWKAKRVIYRAFVLGKH